MAGKAKVPRKEKETTVSTLTKLKLTKSLTLQQHGLLQEAKIICEEILKEEPDNFDGLHLLGLIALQEKDYYQAAKLISKAVDIYPHNSAFFYHLGVALQELGELDGAMISYNLATDLNPDFTEAWYNWGNALQKSKRFDEAVDCYNKTLAGKKDFAEAHHNRAIALKELKKYEEALSAYDQTLALKPDYAEAWVGRGNALAELKRFLDALTDYDYALSLRPDYAEAYLGRATVLQGLEMFDEAIASYDRAIALKPDCATIHQNRTMALKKPEKQGGDNIIRSSDRFALKPLLAGIPGGTCLSISRRLRDSRFVTAYLKGNCIDIGGGQDSIQVYKAFFPLLENVIIYDKEQGDAQYLDNVPDNEFDCLYSSHCLEHLYDPKEALKNWIRVVKPEGFLVITVPDEDLYERGHWPSHFNRDHKWSFTINKHKSWCNDSINVIQLLQHFSAQVKIHKIELQDAGFHYNLGPDIDQTRLATAECVIEIILQKLKER